MIAYLHPKQHKASLLKRLLCILITFVAPVGSNAQTCIIFAKSPTQIYIAADSRTSLTRSIIKNGVKTIEITRELTCKIRRAGNIVFAIAGSGSDISYDLAARCVTEGKTVDSAAALYAKREKEIIEKELQDMRKIDTTYFRQFNQDTAYAQIFFFGFQNSHPTIRDVGFRVKKSMAHPDFPDITSTSTDYSNFQMQCYGHCHAYLKMSDQEIVSMIKTKGIEPTLIDIIKRQINITPDDTGEPVEVLDITVNGWRWYQNLFSCPI